MPSPLKAIPDRDALLLQLATFAGNSPASSFLEIRPLTREGRPANGERAFVPVRELRAAVRHCVDLAHAYNVFVGAAPRAHEDGTAAAVEEVWSLWADLDGPEALARLAAFRPLPSIVVRTGSPDHAHAYWPLRAAISPQGAQRANRRLALALGADPAATDPARILRPAGTLNHKHDPPAEVACTRLEVGVFTLGEVVGHLRDDSRYEPRARPQAHQATGDPSRVISGLARVVREAPTGNRNRATFWAACRVAEHTDIGSAEEQRAVEEIRLAALAAGLGEHEVTATIASALAWRAMAVTA
jgi:RepB DNA-primase from phage plasmid